jgi:hypothetical protein
VLTPAKRDVLRRSANAGTLTLVEAEPLISRGELTAMLFAIADIREDVRAIRNWLQEEDDGEAAQDDA